MYYNQVKYYLKSSNFNSAKLLGFEPKGWNEDDKTLTRSSQNYGVFTNLSDSLEFVKDGAEIIENFYLEYGTEGDLRLEKWVKNDIWEVQYAAELDLKTIEILKNSVKVQLLSGGLQKLIDSQFKEKYNLNRETDINGNIIPPWELFEIDFVGRRIFLESEAEAKDQSITLFAQGFGTPTMLGYRAIPTVTKFESDDQFSFQSGSGQYSNPYNISASDYFYINEEMTKTVLLDLNFTFDIGLIDGNLYRADTVKVNAYLNFFDINTQQEITGSRVFLYTTGNVNPYATGFSFEYYGQITIPEGQAVSIYFELETYQQPQAIGAYVNVDILNLNGYYNLKEDSTRPATKCKFISVYDAFERLMLILTGEENKFESDFFKNRWKFTALTSGELIRNMPDAKITTSLEDLFGLNNYFNIGYFIEKDKLRVEDKSYFFQEEAFLDLGEVDDITISLNEKNLFSSLTFGNEKAGEYEEVQGLAEYNALTTYQTFLKTAKNTYDVKGKIRADAIGAELARRLQYENSPKTDSKYDDEVFILCLTDDMSELRKWNADFEQEPEVYDPETAYNLLLTPFRSMQRHANWFNQGLTKYLDKKTRFSSGTGNTDVVTFLEGDEQPYSEDGTIENSKMDLPFANSEIIEFEKPITQEMYKKIFGSTRIDGKLIKNVYLKLKLTYRGVDYFGWIDEVNLNEPAKWKLIRSYGA